VPRQWGPGRSDRLRAAQRSPRAVRPVDVCAKHCDHLRGHVDVVVADEADVLRHLNVRAGKGVQESRHLVIRASPARTHPEVRTSDDQTPVRDRPDRLNDATQNPRSLGTAHLRTRTPGSRKRPGGPLREAPLISVLIDQRSEAKVAGLIRIRSPPAGSGHQTAAPARNPTGPRDRTAAAASRSRADARADRSARAILGDVPAAATSRALTGQPGNHAVNRSPSLISSHSGWMRSALARPPLSRRSQEYQPARS
jgi:hypothetical protein